MIGAGPVSVFDVAVGGVLSGMIIAMISSFSLLVFTTTVYLAGGQLLRTEATSVNWPELFRVLGFAGIPLIIVPWMLLIHPILAVIALVWFAVLVVGGIRQSLDFDTARAVATAVIAFTIWLIVMTFVMFVFSVFLYVAFYGHL